MHLCQTAWRRKRKIPSRWSSRACSCGAFSFIAKKKEVDEGQRWKLSAVVSLATLLAGQALVGQTGTAAKPKKVRAAVATLTAADVQSLRDAIAAQQAALAQQQQIQELRDELHRKDQTVQQAQ